MGSMMIDTIFFDLDGTIRLNMPSGHAFFCDHAVHLGLAIPPETRRASARWEHAYFSMSPELLEDETRFGDHNHAFWVNFSRRKLLNLGAGPDRSDSLAEAITTYMDEYYHPGSIPPPGAREAIAGLKASGYTLGVFSNRASSYDKELAAIGMEALFPFVLWAGQIGAFKPRPEAFHRVADQAGVSPNRMIYVGDNYYADVAGAQAAGAHPVLFDPAGIFPDADCPVITHFSELPGVIRQLKNADL